MNPIIKIRAVTPMVGINVALERDFSGFFQYFFRGFDFSESGHNMRVVGIEGDPHNYRYRCMG
jgi:hypothetical protein